LFSKLIKKARKQTNEHTNIQKYKPLEHTRPAALATFEGWKLDRKVILEMINIEKYPGSLLSF